MTVSRTTRVPTPLRFGVGRESAESGIDAQDSPRARGHSLAFSSEECPFFAPRSRRTSVRI